jgi:hypothetical protein
MSGMMIDCSIRGGDGEAAETRSSYQLIGLAQPGGRNKWSLSGQSGSRVVIVLWIAENKTRRKR